MYINIKQLWEEALLVLEQEVSKANFTTWFKNTHIEAEDHGVVTIAVPNEFVREWLFTKYHKQILKTLRELNENIRSVEYSISKKNPEKAYQKAEEKRINEITRQNTLNQTLPFTSQVNKKSNLNPRYTQETLIVGSFNELSYSAGLAIINKPGVYNPFYIFGETGLGKTHLIQSIGNTLADKNSEMNILYTNSEKFTTDVVSAIKNNSIDAFKERYRKLDMLIIDDIQFLSGRERTQEELFNIFNHLYDHNKQIIFSSDKHPNYILGLESRLKSRFSQGMVVDINRPDTESKIAILKNKAEQNEYTFIDQQVIAYIASNVDGNIRELEGILNSVNCQAEIKQRPVTVAEVQTLIRNNIKPKKNVSPADIIKTIASFYNIDLPIMFEKTRRKEVVHARQIAMYLLREDYNISFPHIGKEFGGRDHTTVIHSCEKVRELITIEPFIVQELEQLRGMIQTF